MNNAKLFIISAPSGCGKGTLLKEVKKDFDFYLSVSCTTRTPREGEQDGVHYHFITQERFDEMIAEDGFLEYARFDNRSYGTPKKNVEENLADNIDVILEIEPQGAFQVKKKRPDAVMLFILPPSVESLNRRLHRRAAESGETEQQIQARLATARGDIEKAYDYDYVMVNGDLDKAVSDLKKIFTYAKNGDEALKEFSAEKNIKIIDEVLKNA